MDAFIAEIRVFGCNFAPKNWAQCNGQLLAIASNTALFSLIGTTYGGNGTSNFALPNLQGQTAIGQGQGSGLTDYVIGETVGSANVSLLSSEMPAHTHPVNCFNDAGTDPGTSGNVLAASGTDSRANVLYSATVTAPVAMNFQQLANTGISAPHNNMSPYVAMNYCIALQGVFPQRP
ncbi:phage tail protein [Ferruginibacter sp. SUN106]|uniref:phage tail protein n=1 Tax=Ferruginibacter sp. SUN106 TaxID=2978348 RepID=UPI003D363437